MNAQASEFVRYLINGLLATAVHYGVLTVNLELLNFRSAGAANFIAALFGIGTSFMGSRYYVFRGHAQSFVRQAAGFGGLYAGISALHGLALFAWTDSYGFDYRFGFLLATAMQVLLSYFGNKYLVFRT